MLVNDKPLAEDFNFNDHHVSHVLDVFNDLDAMNKYDFKCKAFGGGIGGQAGALRLGIARALLSSDPELRTDLKQAGLLNRDARKVERKKPGQKKARKQFTWVKR